MKVIDIIKERQGHPFPSLEFVPPLKGDGITRLYEAIEPLMEFKPPYMNITCHKDERADGRIVSKRPGTVAIAAAIMKRFPVEVVPHMLCAYTTREEIENELIDLNFLDIDNVMALRGETTRGGEFRPEPGGYSHCSELVAQISDLNHGKYLEDNLQNAVPANFCIGVAGYPEKHYQADDLATDIRHLKKKVDAGADYIITQMFFDNRKFYNFVELCRKEGISCPIIPGLKPVSSKKHLSSLPESFALEFPDELRKEMEQCDSDKEVYELGIEWCTAQSRDLLNHGAPAIHYYTMGRAANIKAVLRQIF